MVAYAKRHTRNINILFLFICKKMIIIEYVFVVKMLKLFCIFIYRRAEKRKFSLRLYFDSILCLRIYSLENRAVYYWHRRHIGSIFRLRIFTNNDIFNCACAFSLFSAHFLVLLAVCVCVYFAPIYSNKHLS